MYGPKCRQRCPVVALHDTNQPNTRDRGLHVQRLLKDGHIIANEQGPTETICRAYSYTSQVV